MARIPPPPGGLLSYVSRLKNVPVARMVELGAQAVGETSLSGHIAAVIRAEGTARGKAVRSPY